MSEHEWLTSEDPAVMLRLRQTECCGCFWMHNGDGTASLCRDCVPCGRCDNGPILPVTPFSDRKLLLWVEVCRAYWQHNDRGELGNYDLDSPSGLTTACENWSRCHPTVIPINPLPMRAHLLRDIIGNPFRPVALPKRCEQCGSPNDGMFDDGITCRCTGVFGCPWLTPTVLSLAQAAYETRPIDDTLDPVRLMILADALEEAGCDDVTVLRHLRGEKVCCVCCGTGEGKLNDDRPEAPPGSWRVCDCGGSGWRNSRGPHVRGCWAVDLILGKE